MFGAENKKRKTSNTMNATESTNEEVSFHSNKTDAIYRWASISRSIPIKVSQWILLNAGIYKEIGRIGIERSGGTGFPWPGAYPLGLEGTGAVK